MRRRRAGEGPGRSWSWSCELSDRTFVMSIATDRSVMCLPMPRRSALEAAGTRESIIRRAADIGSVEGLEGITIGLLAADLEMSTAGVVGHSGPKEEFRPATLELAAELSVEQVGKPVEDLRPGLERLLGICESWTHYAD